MNTNLKSAKQAIEAELSYARQGLVYYTSRVEALENALHQLESVESVEVTSSSAPKVGASRGRRKAHAAAANGSPKQRNSGPTRAGKRRAGRGSDGAGGLPSTGGDFWLNLVGTEPQSAVDISNAAAVALGIGADQKTQIQKLKQRVSPALTSLVSAHKIQDTGAGRERRFFKSGNQAG